jgi:zinc finger protein
VNARCPACGASGLTLTTTELDLPYFGKCLETLLHCPACRFRHSDLMILDQKDPMRHALTIRSPEDLSARVVRANSCTIRVPEVGFLAEPTPRSEAFVTNVQGVLERVRSVLITARTIYADEPESVRVAEERLALLAEIEAGEKEGTVILDDPFGNSAILADAAEARPLTQEEVDALETGYVVFDKEDFEDGNLGEPQFKS